ncbi:pyridine nucleotide-disulfide oxidoreductase-like protein [Parathielavia hyrcaniae]|uniref:Pyridine nucleotide-disulfide oxidoreductase-like protein n=1 Tax=Parathielavia hyrcaniae TaxID=113614 RepID=A0AAN6T1B0_9PEZI|nr:pyridine nucleotide-disulfide oxidoreductase-like protein [Parathielavia hyrcaniae]
MGSIPEASRSLNSTTTHPFRVLVAGGAYGGLSAALNLQDLCRGLPPRCGPSPDGAGQIERPQFAVDITIVDERDGYFHLIGSPLALASEAYTEKAWVKYNDIPALRSPNIRVLQGSVKAVDPRQMIATFAAHGSGETSDLPYDYFVAATGLRRVWPVVPQSLRRKQYLFEAGEHVRAATAAKHGVVIVGGGAVGIEMAAELKLLHPHLSVTLVHSRDKLLSSEPLPDEVKDRALQLVREADVAVLMSHRLDRTEQTQDEHGNKCLRLHFTNGHAMLADQVSMAVSRPVPSTAYLPSSVLDEEGYVKIQANLTFPPNTPNAAAHFAIGDLVRWSGIKRCGAAMHMGYHAANNMHQQMQMQLHLAAGRNAAAAPPNPKFLELAEIPPMIGLAVGRKAVSYWPEAGVDSGEEVMRVFFGEDLGFGICWNHLRLGIDGGKE